MDYVGAHLFGDVDRDVVEQTAVCIDVIACSDRCENARKRHRRSKARARGPLRKTCGLPETSTVATQAKGIGRSLKLLSRNTEEQFGQGSERPVDPY